MMFPNTFNFIENALLDNLTNELKKYGVIFKEEQKHEESHKESFENLYEYAVFQNYSYFIDFKHSCDVQTSLIKTDYDFIVSGKMATCKCDLLSEEMQAKWLMQSEKEYPLHLL